MAARAPFSDAMTLVSFNSGEGYISILFAGLSDISIIEINWFELNNSPLLKWMKRYVTPSVTFLRFHAELTIVEESFWAYRHKPVKIIVIVRISLFIILYFIGNYCISSTASDTFTT